MNFESFPFPFHSESITVNTEKWLKNTYFLSVSSKTIFSLRAGGGGGGSEKEKQKKVKQIYFTKAPKTNLSGKPINTIYIKCMFYVTY